MITIGQSYFFTQPIYIGNPDKFRVFIEAVFWILWESLFNFVAQDPALNDTHFETKVNFLDYWETDKKGKKQHFSFITDIHLTKKNVELIMRGGRARWRIENETFNTLKNQGYNFEHNFGHGNKYLCTVLGMLMMLAFFVGRII